MRSDPDGAPGQRGPAADFAESYVKLGREEGAELAYGGRRPEVPGLEGGFYYEPTVFANVDNRMRIAQEEIFGPVVCVIKFEDDEEAAAIANDSIYGLGGGVWSRDIGPGGTGRRRGCGPAPCGSTTITPLSDFCPFGGYKQSGNGRELGFEGLSEYTEIKSASTWPPKGTM